MNTSNTKTLFLANVVAMCILSAQCPMIADEPEKDIVQTATAAGSFRTLLKAVAAADLTEVLNGSGPFTVFAPTDEAFAAVPKEELEALLKDKEKLSAVLTYHVVPGRLVAANVGKRRTMKTAQGEELTIGAREGQVKINEAKVVKTDILCSNGVIHVIDAVLLPPEPASPAARKAKAALEDETSADPVQRLDRLKAAAEEVRQLAASNPMVHEELTEALEQAAELEDHDASILALQSALRRAAEVLAFRPLREAELPKGFPEPTPVGQVELKSYPAYRLARTEMSGLLGQNRAFFTLFEHISRKKIEMTVPVEMTYEEGESGWRGKSMAFLYGDLQIGSPGQTGRVNVVDVPAMQVVSIGLLGEFGPERVAWAEKHLQQWLHEHADRYRAAGKLRVLGYNSPMVPIERRYAEVQLPVTECK